MVYDSVKRPQVESLLYALDFICMRVDEQDASETQVGASETSTYMRMYMNKYMNK